MTNKKVTLLVGPKIYDAYKKYCKEKGLIISRQFEIMIEEHLRERVKE